MNEITANEVQVGQSILTGIRFVAGELVKSFGVVAALDTPRAGKVRITLSSGRFYDFNDDTRIEIKDDNK